jgi:Fur family peroxide stress response transcriptional regulator
MTHQRAEIFKELAVRHDHPSAEDLYRSIRDRIPTMALDTVYRTLNTFESINAIRRLDVFDEKARFDANLEPHHHCICTRCRTIVDFKWENFDVMDPPDAVGAWGRFWSKSVILRGVCRKCLTQGAAS